VLGNRHDQWDLGGDGFFDRRCGKGRGGKDGCCVRFQVLGSLAGMLTLGADGL